ncbi:anthranilate phosphoribosyltransferase [Aeoliella sp. ICT_H6.2]|uniref:Anthranilate phosphoribosyltransferase n=1 Tax=Aeoliella straminimaris TaxID=2954799 RepID=A0A9X2FC78_9BACT|nr:anthranilate phosphoribosyltransferase [Aeoliella straminimaris]MCO6045488.1 anthranilate phosphoribosyltransferase [Aeoliella straminimaris]
MNPQIAEIVGRVVGGIDLTMAEMQGAMDLMMEGTSTDEEISLLLTGLAAKGETVDEVAGAAASMRSHMTTIRSSRAGVLDTCGTGGGGSQTFNISTTAAIVAAAAGVPVAKHGNRSVTSRSGSADVLAALGVNLDATREQVEACLDELGLCFCFAPLAHPSMRHVAPVRKKLGIRTVFNLLGPLANPAGAEFQLLGAGLANQQDLLAQAMHRLGTRRTLVVHGADGMGDVTCSTTTRVLSVTPEGIEEFEWSPADFGLTTSPLDALQIETPEESAALVSRLLAGELGAPRDVVVLNAAAGLLAAGKTNDPKTAAMKAAEAIDSGAAAELLRRLGERSHAPA